MASPATWPAQYPSASGVGVRRPVSTPCRLKAAQIAVKGRFIGHSVLPTAPENPHPCATKGADRVGMVLPTRPCPPIDLAGPGMPVAGRGGGRSGFVAQPPVSGAGGTRPPPPSPPPPPPAPPPPPPRAGVPRVGR